MDISRAVLELDVIVPVLHAQERDRRGHRLGRDLRWMRQQSWPFCMVTGRFVNGLVQMVVHAPSILRHQTVIF